MISVMTLMKAMMIMPKVMMIKVEDEDDDDAEGDDDQGRGGCERIP